MAKNGKHVELAPATSFKEVSDRTGIDQGKISRYAHTGSTHGLNSRDLDKIFTAAGGKDGWQALVVSSLHLAEETPGVTATGATAGL